MILNNKAMTQRREKANEQLGEEKEDSLIKWTKSKKTQQAFKNSGNNSFDFTILL